MACLVLLSTTGFSMNLHFCGGQMQDVSFFGDEVECSMMQKVQDKPSCPMHAMKAMDCCKDQDLNIDSKSPETLFVKNLELHNSLSLAVLPVEQEMLSPVLTRSIIPLLPYRPPPADREIIILVQSFLI